MSYGALKGNTNQGALTSHASYSCISWSHQKERNCCKTCAIVNSYRIKNVRFTLPIIKSPGYTSWSLTQLFLWLKMEKKKKSSQSVEPFLLFPKLPLWPGVRYPRHIKMHGVSSSLVSEVSGAGDH